MQIDNGAIKVLLVDSNREVLRFLERSLARNGFPVATAQSGSDARRVVCGTTNLIGIISEDLADTSGIELALELLTAMPDSRAMITTWRELGPEKLQLCVARGLPVIVKPFSVGTVLDYVRHTQQALRSFRTESKEGNIGIDAAGEPSSQSGFSFHRAVIKLLGKGSRN